MSKVKMTNRVEMRFDLGAATARDITPLLKGLSGGKLSNMAAILAKVALECPADWGDPNEVETYAKLPMNGGLGLAWKALQMEIESDKSDPRVTFDLGALTAVDFDALNAGLQQNNPEAVAELLAAHVVSCDVVDDPHDVDQYLDLPYYTYFRKLMVSLSKHAEEELTNFRTLYIG